MKAMVVLIALIALGLLAIKTQRKRGLDSSVGPATPGRLAMSQVASSVGSRKVEPDRPRGGNPTSPHFTSAPIDASHEIETRAIRDICEALSSGNAARREQAYTYRLTTLIWLDPEAAGDLAENWKPGPIREEFLRRVGREWTKRDWMWAVQWAATIKDNVDRKRTLVDECIQVSREDPVAAVAIADCFKVGNAIREPRNAGQLAGRR